MIDELECHVRVGVTEQERRARQRVLIDLELGLNLRKAGERDRVEETVDYAAVSKAVRRFTESGTFHLAEAIAEGTAALVLECFPLVKEAKVRVRKFSVPGARSVGVVLSRGKPRKNS